MRFDEEHLWASSEIDFCGFPAWLRRNESLGNVVRREYPKRLMVSLAFADPDHDGLPRPSESASVGEFEQRIASLLEQDHDALFAFTLTFDGGRDLFFYLHTDPGDDTIEKIIADTASPCRIEFQVDEEEEDPWSLYDSFADTITE